MVLHFFLILIGLEHEESKGGEGWDPGGRDPLPQGREGTPGGSGEGDEPTLWRSAQLPWWHEVLPAEGQKLHLQSKPGADGEQSWSPGTPGASTVPGSTPPCPGPDPSCRALTCSPPPAAPPAPTFPHPAGQHELREPGTLPHHGCTSARQQCRLEALAKLRGTLIPRKEEGEKEGKQWREDLSCGCKKRLIVNIFLWLYSLIFFLYIRSIFAPGHPMP